MAHDHGHGEGGSFYVHLLAGAAAGFAEHCGMYPIDTIKTHIQAIRPTLVGAGNGNYIGALQITREIISKSGFTGLFRGLTAVAAGAAPSHAVHFSMYEFLKHRLIGSDDEGHHPIKVSFAGVIATMSSEAVNCPMDVVKQRLQLQVTNYKGLLDCTKKIYLKEGLKGLYSGYTTTLVMNVPYNIIYFPAYESLKKVIINKKKLQGKQQDENTYEWLIHLFAGGGAGMLAAAITNPFDVAKTRLQTQGDVGGHYKGMVDALKTIWKEEGTSGYLRGMKPRIVFHSMSSAIVWSVYEYFKFIMGE